MANLFQLNIRTPEAAIFDAQASSLCLPEDSGYMGVLAHHAPLISTLKPGKITFKDGEGREQTVLSTTKGIVEIADNRVVILLDSVI